MSELIKCETCLGRRSVTGMGGITKKCPDCNGIGWFEDKPLPNQATHVNQAAKKPQVTDSVTTKPAKKTIKKPRTTRKAA